MNGYQFFDGFQGGGDGQYLLCLIFFFIVGASMIKNEKALVAYTVFLIGCYVFPVILLISFALIALFFIYVFFIAKSETPKKGEIKDD